VFNGSPGAGGTNPQTFSGRTLYHARTTTFDLRLDVKGFNIWEKVKLRSPGTPLISCNHQLYWSGTQIYTPQGMPPGRIRRAQVNLVYTYTTFNYIWSALHSRATPSSLSARFQIGMRLDSETGQQHQSSEPNPLLGRASISLASAATVLISDTAALCHFVYESHGSPMVLSPGRV